MSSPSAVDALLVEFARELRAEGIRLGTDDALSFCLATAQLDVTDLMDVYWAGRATLVRRRDQIATFDRVFRRFFLDAADTDEKAVRPRFRASSTLGAALEIPNTEPGLPGEVNPEETRLGYLASVSDIFRHKAFAECSDEEIRQLRRMIARLKVTPPRRRTYRHIKARRGSTMDIRRMARSAMRSLGEGGALAFKERKRKLRPLVLILDVSGSMADYSRNLLQFAYAARRASAKVDVFCFGTRLTRITRDLDRRNPDEAMTRAGVAVLDWDGGTRIGDSLRDFVRQARRSRLGRGAIVVVCSDGLDRGDPQDLAEAMAGLARIAHRVVWVNPHKGDSEHFVPTSLGMIVADPYIDEVHSGHNLASLEALATRLAKAGAR